MTPEKINQVVDGKHVTTDGALLLADDAYWDGHNYERSGRNIFLWKSRNSNYFIVRQTLWQGEHTTIELITPSVAVNYWEHLPEHHVEFEQAFGPLELAEY